MNNVTTHLADVFHSSLDRGLNDKTDPKSTLPRYVIGVYGTMPMMSWRHSEKYGVESGFNLIERTI
jgi:hypothetical protein